jgi:hypothetical protein
MLHVLESPGKSDKKQVWKLLITKHFPHATSGDGIGG